MKKFLIYILIALIIFVIAMEIPEVWYQKEVPLEGMDRLSEKGIRKLLPLDRSTFWWHFNSDSVVLKVKQHPGIKDASLHYCGSFSWDCFILTLSEREPVLLAVHKNDLWMMGEGGSSMEHVKLTQKKQLVNIVRKIRLPLVSGLHSADSIS